LDILYPPLCLHCQAQLLKHIPLFCPECLDLISLIEVKERCTTCFGELGKKPCHRCIHRPVIIQRQIAACEGMGPEKTLLNVLYRGRREAILPAAALMAYQWLQQKMPLPDLLIPLPISWGQKLRHGFDLHLLLAKEVGKLFSVPVHSALKRRFDRAHFLTAGEFRFQLISKTRQASLTDKHCMLIAPHLDDALFRQAGAELKAFFPARIDALSFAL
jgi:predicted amidophosphoribosyltransferase